MGVLSEFSNLGVLSSGILSCGGLSVSQYLWMVLVVDILTEYCYPAVVNGRRHPAVHNKRSQPYF